MPTTDVVQSTRRRLQDVAQLANRLADWLPAVAADVPMATACRAFLAANDLHNRVESLEGEVMDAVDFAGDLPEHVEEVGAMTTARTEYLIRLRPDVKDGHPVVTLRKALKTLLRGFGLRAVAVEEVQGAPPRGNGLGRGSRPTGQNAAESELGASGRLPNGGGC